MGFARPAAQQSQFDMKDGTSRIRPEMGPQPPVGSNHSGVGRRKAALLEFLSKERNAVS